MSKEELGEMRIVKAPYLKKVEGYRRKIKVFLCSDGKEYSFKQLGELIGISYDGLRSRVDTYGWESELIFAPKRQGNKTIDNKEVKKKKLSEVGNAAWQALKR